MKELTVFFLIMLTIACGSRKVDRSYSSEKRDEQHTEKARRENASHQETKEEQEDRFELSQLLYNIRTRDSTPYYFRQGDVEFFGNADLTASRTDTVWQTRIKKVIVHDTIVTTDTIAKDKKKYDTTRQEKRTQRSDPVAWPLIIGFCIGLLVGVYGKRLYSRITQKRNQ